MNLRCRVVLLAWIALAVAPRGLVAQAVLETIESGVLPDHWLTGGPKCMEMPEWEVREYNPTFYILRQSGCTDFEKPFVYMLFGKDRALLLDTGSRNGNLAPTLQRTVHRWLTRNSPGSISLVVVHTHGHDDHVAGDHALAMMNDPAMPVTLIAATVEADTKFFGIQHWPDGTGSVDLGERIIDAIPIPGHAETSVALYDRRTGVLFSGDSLYPGRLYIRDLAVFQASTERMVRFTAQKPVSHIMGNHIEQMRTPFRDYPTGTIYQPDEHALALSRASLLELADALGGLHGSPARVRLRDFTLWPKSMDDRERAAEERAFHDTNDKQLLRMWDQPSP